MSHVDDGKDKICKDKILKLFGKVAEGLFYVDDHVFTHGRTSSDTN